MYTINKRGDEIKYRKPADAPLCREWCNQTHYVLEIMWAIHWYAMKTSHIKFTSDTHKLILL
jgi:hypothetical protein